MALPTLPVTLPPATPFTGGLYDAATIIDDAAARHLGGVTVTDPNVGGHGRWQLPAPDDGNPDKVGDRLDPTDHPATVVWAADSAKSVSWTDDEALARAEHVLRLIEPVEVEQHVAEQFATLTADDTASSWVDAVALADLALAKAGHTGVVHVYRAHLAALQDASMIVRQSGRMLTPGGNVYAFGAGYEALGSTIVATGDVFVRRGPVTSLASLDHASNTRTGLAERVVAPYWGNPVSAITVNIAP